VSKVILHIDERGKLAGIDEKNQRAYGRFRAKLEKLRPGDTLAFSFALPRSPRMHRYHFALLGAFFSAQEVFRDDDEMRKWVEVGAGFCSFLPGPGGQLVALPKSISWEKLEESDFREHHLKVVEFLRSPYCYRHLWPHLDDAAGELMAETILMEFE
jgi:hypothetical protein